MGVCFGSDGVVRKDANVFAAFVADDETAGAEGAVKEGVEPNWNELAGGAGGAAAGAEGAAKEKDDVGVAAVPNPPKPPNFGADGAGYRGTDLTYCMRSKLFNSRTSGVTEVDIGDTLAPAETRFGRPRILTTLDEYLCILQRLVPTSW